MNIARIEGKLVVVSERTDVAVYDFDFELAFDCDHPHAFETRQLGILRIGAIHDYAAEFAEKAEWGIDLANDPEAHDKASELERWYPVISDLTPRSRVFEQLPDVGEIEATFGWPIFVKGSRQTSKHSASLSVARDAASYAELVRGYSRDPILHWQKPVVREFVELEPVHGSVPMKVRPSVEFRSFWWNGICVGWGPYWYQLSPYSAADIEDGLAIAEEAARRLQVPFLVVDIARTVEGRWIVIECNDAQESGYVGIDPRALWQRVLGLI